MNEKQLLTYEIPLNEQMRSFLRAQHLISTLKHDYSQTNQWDSTRALGTVVTLYRFLDQTDIKHLLLQALEHDTNSLKRLLHTPEVDLSALNQVLDNLSSAMNKLSSSHTQFEKLLQENPILSQFSGRQFVGMTPDFDLPELHFWLNLDLKSKQIFLDDILAPLGPIIQSLDLYLNLTRQCALFHQVQANNGTFKKQIKPPQNPQLIQIKLDKDLGVYPKISANKQCINISFYEFSMTQHARNKTQQNIPFQLTCCSIS